MARFTAVSPPDASITPDTAPDSWRRTFAVLGSLKAGVILLLMLSTAMAAATVFEAMHGPAAAQRGFYQSPWFTSLLVAVGVNLLASTLVRWSTARRRLAFLMAHLGSLIILIGGGVTNRFGTEGRMRLAEGESSNAMTTTRQVMAITSLGESTGAEIVLALPMQGDRPREGFQGRIDLNGGPLTIHVDNVSTAGQWRTSYHQADRGPGAVRLVVQGGDPSNESMSTWLAEGSECSLGRVHVELAGSQEALDARAAEAMSSAIQRTWLVIGDGVDAARVPLADAMKSEVSVGADLVLRVRVTAFHPDSLVDDAGRLTDRSTAVRNPAVELELDGPKGVERRIVYALFPEADANRTTARSYGHVKISLDAIEALIPDPILRLFRSERGLSYVALGSQSGESAGDVRVGEPIAPEILGLPLTVDRDLTHAVEIQDPVFASTSKRELEPPCLRMHALQGGEESQFWLGWRRPQVLIIGGHRYRFDFREALATLPFTITLEHCRRRVHPGTGLPAMFESRLALRNEDSESADHEAVSVNRPLNRAEYTIFQTGVEHEGERDISVLSVSRDPGRPVVYLGFMLTCVGVVLMVAMAPRSLASSLSRLAPEARSQSANGLHRLLWIAVVLFFARPVAADESYDEWSFDAIRAIPVQSNGRVAPIDTLARGYVRTVTGRAQWDGHDPVALVLAWVFEPQNWINQPMVLISDEALIRDAGLDSEVRHFSLLTLSQCEKFQLLADAAMSRADSGEKPEGSSLEALRVAHRMTILRSCLRGEGLPLLPDTADPEAAWSGLSISTTAENPRVEPCVRIWRDLAAAFHARDALRFESSSVELASRLQDVASADYPSPEKIYAELRYNRLQPFRCTMALMAFAVGVSLAARLTRRGNRMKFLAVIVLIAGCVVWLLGISLRWFIAGRAPLSNMYESLVALSGGVAVVGLFFAIVFRHPSAIWVASALSASGLAFAEWLPLDPDIDPLAPALSGTAWLTIHVCTILLGYAAATFAMGLSHVQLALALFGGKSPAQSARMDQLIYQSVRSVVVLLTCGIVFGAMWADAAWGRYWGWDPKETWALITLFVYLSTLHARSAGWLGEFGTAVSGILAFQLVMMTYYGVNFVLGLGLHSYGFGSGGQSWALAFLACECAFVILSAACRPRPSHD